MLNDQDVDVKQVMLNVAELPDVLRPIFDLAWQDFIAKASFSLPDDDAWLAAMCKVWACSDFVAKACIHFPEMLADLIESGDLQARYEAEKYHQHLAELLADVSDDTQLAVILRKFRRREMVRLAWRDIAGWAELNETLKDLSTLARACVDVSLDHLHIWQVHDSGQPIGRDSGEPQQLVVLGMGKLGADELNYSSDIDLIFAYPEEGETDGGRYPITNGEFFTRLGRRLIAAINQQTGDGFVFRVDMRLRPFGDTGPLAASFGAMENYYQTHGREWERYAMIKAAVIAGDQVAGEELMAMLKPFIYRRYLDYGAFESLREMKGMIAAQYKRKGMLDNIKLGPGGIREIEFIGQAFQLIRGGRLRELQIRPIQKVLNLLVEHDLLPEFAVAGLQKAYVFLRLAENHLQAIADQQIHSLPTNEVDRMRLAYSMGFSEWAAFDEVLRVHMSTVHERFEQVFAAPQREHTNEYGSVFDTIWKSTSTDEEALAILESEGFSDSAAALALIVRLRDGSVSRSLSSRGHERLDRLMPLLLGAIVRHEQPEVVLGRLIKLIETIARRTSYLALLVENPMGLSQLVKLCAASAWLADHLARYPVLLDGLLDARDLYAPLSYDSLKSELLEALVHVEGDLEQEMEALRYFKQANVLRVAAADVVGAYPLMVVSDHLTWIAEVVMGQVVKIAYQHLIRRHGRPCCIGEDGRTFEPDFLVIAYGKMGGFELGYSSDLDVVFLHGNYKSGGQTDGKSPVDNLMFFARLGQRIIHIMTTLMPAGVLYDIDSRLRPAGDAGPLVSSLTAFAKYQRDEAWTWEHQALVRARVVHGSSALNERFDTIRAKVLTAKREVNVLQTEVLEMRQKMRQSLSKAKPGLFDLKQDSGGIVDIEFIVQYAVLRWVAEYPALLRWTDNIRLLETLAAEGLLSTEMAEQLADVYRAYRNEAHRCALQDQKPVLPEKAFVEMRETVNRVWRDLLESVE